MSVVTWRCHGRRAVTRWRCGGRLARMRCLGSESFWSSSWSLDQRCLHLTASWAVVGRRKKENQFGRRKIDLGGCIVALHQSNRRRKIYLGDCTVGWHPSNGRRKIDLGDSGRYRSKQLLFLSLLFWATTGFWKTRPINQENLPVFYYLFPNFRNQNFHRFSISFVHICGFCKTGLVQSLISVRFLKH
jgi:hypothetical protein